MSVIRIDRFPHRRNRNGSFDAICPRCYRTIATTEHEAELDEIEHEHKCEGLFLVTDEFRGPDDASTDPDSKTHLHLAQ